jgi:shikimate kinase
MESRIFLIGFMGSGKSTLCGKLARKLGYECVDMDKLIEETSGMSIPGIFIEHGEKVFRKWERDILNELCQREKIVVSTGGGAPCHEDMIDVMNRNGTTIYIQVPPAALLERLVRSRTERPLLKNKTPEELRVYIETLLAEREPYYLQAQLKVDGIYLNTDTLAGILKKS